MATLNWDGLIKMRGCLLIKSKRDCSKAQNIVEKILNNDKLSEIEQIYVDLQSAFIENYLKNEDYT